MIPTQRAWGGLPGAATRRAHVGLSHGRITTALGDLGMGDELPVDPLDAGLRLARSFELTKMCGEDDVRVAKWDELVATAS